MVSPVQGAKVQDEQLAMSPRGDRGTQERGRVMMMISTRDCSDCHGSLVRIFLEDARSIEERILRPSTIDAIPEPMVY